jgi:hypothetical protein
MKIFRLFPRWLKLATGALLAAAAVNAQILPTSLVRQYVPMNDGDHLNYISDIDYSTTGRATFTATSFNGNSVYEVDSGNAFISIADYYSYSDDALLFHGEDFDGSLIVFDTPVPLVNGQTLANNGTVTGTTTFSYYESGYYQGSGSLTIRSTVSSIGDVTVPAGNYSGCKKLVSSMTVTIFGQTQSYEAATWVMASRIGIVKQGIYSDSTGLLSGYWELQDGTVNGTAIPSWNDPTPPSIKISAPLPNQIISNSVYTVTGTATDNVAVATVYYSLSNALINIVFTPAWTTNSWGNWNTNVTLAPGANTIRACAVDSSGNISATNSVTLAYVLSGLLQIRTIGLGTLSPNYSNAMLEIGKSYGMTATASAGFTFTNWMISTNWLEGVASNSATLNFVMRSNLTLQASFVDSSKPTLSITNLVAGGRVSNAVFAVRGTAGDNWQISNVVCQINGGGWNSATNLNHWTNWAAGVTLVPGTNLVAVYAVDTTGNRSTTNSMSFQFVVTNQLGVCAIGLGTLSPNYSNAWLEVGRNYTMAASPGSGFVATNWIISTNWAGGTATNNAVVQFMMGSNLTLQVTFADVTKPTLSITNLIAGQRVSNAVFTVRGTAGDNWQVGNVAYQLNGGAWSNALSANKWTNWSGNATLRPGTNVVLACAVDSTGNASVTNIVVLQFVVTNQLGVRATGLGTLSPNYSNAWLEVGRNYTMTASPGSGFVFTNWLISTNWAGGAVSNSSVVQFMMASNLTLQLNFLDITKPTLTVASPIAGQRMTNALASLVGTASDNWKVASVWYQLNSNAWDLAGTTSGYTNWTRTVTLLAGTNTLKVYALDLGGNCSVTNSISVVSSNAFNLKLALAAEQPLASDGRKLVLQLSPGLNGRIEVSTNLVSWAALTSFIGTNTTLTFRDSAATNDSQRFYRAVIPNEK